jgi:hypothetical protein
MSMYTIMTSIHIHSQEEGKKCPADYHFASRVGARGG